MLVSAHVGSVPTYLQWRDKTVIKLNLILTLLQKVQNPSPQEVERIVYFSSRIMCHKSPLNNSFYHWKSAIIANVTEMNIESPNTEVDCDWSNILASDWLIVITLTVYWPLIGYYREYD